MQGVEGVSRHREATAVLLQPIAMLSSGSSLEL